MFDIQNYASFITAILVFQLIPGAGTLAILNATSRHGLRAGFSAVLGTLTGDLVFMLAAMAGLATVMQANPILFEFLQWFGAAYLCWLGFQLLRSPVAESASGEDASFSVGQYFRQALLVSLTNPKVILFFVAFFPLFLLPNSSSITLVSMMLHVTLISLLYQTCLVLMGNALARRLKSIPAARKIATRLAGIAIIGFGIKLAINNW